MSVQCAYRSTSPQVLAAFGAAQDAYRAYADAIFAVLASHVIPGSRGVFNEAGFRPGAFMGVALDKAEDAPHGWRATDSHGTRMAVPDKRTAAGKAAARALKAAGCPPRLTLPGMPGTVQVGERSGIRVCQPGIRLIAGSVWVTWSTVLEAATAWDRRPAVADGALWEQVPLSDWRAAAEADDCTGAGVSRG